MLRPVNKTTLADINLANRRRFSRDARPKITRGEWESASRAKRDKLLQTLGYRAESTYVSEKYDDLPDFITGYGSSL